MKKGLLSLLALALTVVGCQNYDDQFDELTSQISSLQNTVDGLTGVSTQIQNLQGLVTGLSQSLTTVQSTVDGITNYDDSGVVAQLDAVSTTLASLLNQLAGVATSADLGIISSTLAEVQANVRELLEANAVINQNIVITNSAQLDYVDSLISTEDGDPNVIINGYVNINTNFTPAITADELATVNAIASKMASVLGEDGGTRGVEVTSSTSITFENLVYVDADFDVNTTHPNIPELRTISGDLDIDAPGDVIYGGPADQGLASVGGNVILSSAAATGATQINFANVTIEGTLSHGSGADLTFPAALSVDLGSAAFESLTANSANAIVSALSSTASNLTITALNGGSIDFNSLVTASGNVSITGVATSTFRANLLTTVTGTLEGIGQNLHFPALESVSVRADLDGVDAVELSSLVNVSSPVDLNDTPAVILTDLEEIDNTFTWNVIEINLPGVNVDAGSIVSTVATNVTVGAVDDISADLPSTVTHLTLDSQDADLTAVAAQGALHTLTITADSDSAGDISFTDNAAAATASLTTLITTDVATLTLTGDSLVSFDATNGLYIDIASTSDVVTATTSGDIIRFISASPDLAEWANTANVKDDPAVTSGEEAVTVDIESSQLASVDLSSMNKVRVVDLGSTNSNLVQVIAPSTEDLLTPGANPRYEIHLSMTVSYTAAQLAVEDGVNPRVDFVEACLEAPGVSTWPAYITAVLAANPTATTTIDFDDVVELASDGTVSTTHVDITTAFAADSASADAGSKGRPTADGGAGVLVGTVGAQEELAIISATACN